MKRISAGFVLGLVALVFVPGVCCAAADAAATPPVAPRDVSFPGTWKFTFEADTSDPAYTLAAPADMELVLEPPTVVGVDAGNITIPGNKHYGSWVGSSDPPVILLQPLYTSISMAVVLGDGTMSGVYSSEYHPDPTTTQAGQGSFAAIRVKGSGGISTPKNNNVNVSGTWAITTTPNDIKGGQVYWFFSKATVGSDDTTQGTVNDAGGNQVATYTVENAGVTITVTSSTTTSGGILTLTGSVEGNGMSGTYADSSNPNATNTTWKAVEGVPTVVAAEGLSRGVVGAVAGTTKTYQIQDNGKFQLSAVIPVTADVLDALNENSTFGLSFVALPNFATTFGSAGYQMGDKKIQCYVDANAIINGPQTTRPGSSTSHGDINFSLDWSSKTTLKIKITEKYYYRITAQGPIGRGISPQAEPYIESSSETLGVLDVPCVITFGTQTTTLSIRSGVSVITGETTKTKDGLTYTPSAVSIGSTIPKGVIPTK